MTHSIKQAKAIKQARKVLYVLCSVLYFLVFRVLQLEHLIRNSFSVKILLIFLKQNSLAGVFDRRTPCSLKYEMDLFSP